MPSGIDGSVHEESRRESCQGSGRHGKSRRRRRRRVTQVNEEGEEEEVEVSGV